MQGSGSAFIHPPSCRKELFGTKRDLFILRDFEAGARSLSGTITMSTYEPLTLETKYQFRKKLPIPFKMKC